MRRWAGSIAAVGMVSALVCGLARGEEKDTYQVPRTSKKAWYWPFNGWPWEDTGKKPAHKTEKAEQAEKPKKVTDPIEAPVPSPVTQERGATMAREQARFIRRQQVCDRLREIAQETGNVELEKQAQLLEQRAWYVYEQKTVQARMPGLTPLETTAAARKLLSDEPAPKQRSEDRPVHSVSAKADGKLNREED